MQVFLKGQSGKKQEQLLREKTTHNLLKAE
jgi:hypothetical protein